MMQTSYLPLSTSIKLTRLIGVKNGEPLREATVYHSLRSRFSIQQVPWKFIDGQTMGRFAAGPKLKQALRKFNGFI